MPRAPCRKVVERMGRVAVVTDSSACLPQEIVGDLGIHVVPLRFFIDDHYQVTVDACAACCVAFSRH